MMSIAIGFGIAPSGVRMDRNAASSACASACGVTSTRRLVVSELTKGVGSGWCVNIVWRPVGGTPHQCCGAGGVWVPEKWCLPLVGTEVRTR